MDLLIELRQQLSRFDAEAAVTKTALLTRISQTAFVKAKDLLMYHDMLLFMAAYPQNSRLLKQTEKELHRVAEAATAMYSRGTREAAHLTRSGIAGSETQANFSLTLCRHLLKTYDDTVQLYSCEGDENWSREILRCALPQAESEQLNDPSVTLESWLLQQQRVSGTNALRLLIRLLDHLHMSDAIREQVFEALRVFVSIKLTPALPSRTLLRIPAGPLHFQRKEVEKRTDALTLIHEPLGKPLPLHPHEKQAVIEAARASLMLLNRETDTITYTCTQSVEVYETGRGIRVALFELEPARRLPFETYAGYMAFKNGIPVAYGGAWPFAYTAKIGLNIYEPFRGGESAYLFCQLMRVYQHRFGIREFTVEPYQMGHGNKEGLLSGAFWFYYRMGFRPVDEKTARLAETEYTQICRQKGYRTPLPVMKKLVSVPAALAAAPLPKGALTQAHLTWLSTQVSNYITSSFNGDRQLALQTCSRLMRQQLQITSAQWKKIPPQQQESFRQLSLLFAQLTRIKQWNLNDRKRLLQLMLGKGSESEYLCVKMWQQNSSLQQDMTALLENM